MGFLWIAVSLLSLVNFSEASGELLVEATPLSNKVIRSCDDDPEVRENQNKPKWVGIHCSEEVNTWRLAPTQGARSLPTTQQINISTSSENSATENSDKMTINQEDQFNFVCPKLEAIVESVRKTWSGDCDALVNALRVHEGSIGKLCYALIQEKRSIGDFESIATGKVAEFCARTPPQIDGKLRKPGRGQ